MNLALKYQAEEVQTPVYFGYDLLSDPHFLKHLKSDKGRFAIITDEKVASYYGEPLLKFMKKEAFECELMTFAGGEKNKTRETKEGIENELLSQGFGRDTTLIALGGGIVTDIVGFVAATYCRGIPYLSIPTTLLGMVDASLGGKTGVNLKSVKNLIGAIYPPRAIFMDLTMLSTLPNKEMLNGSAEILKAALIASKTLLAK